VLGEPRPTSEIAELRYFTVGEYTAMQRVAPGSMLVFRRLHELNLIGWWRWRRVLSSVASAMMTV
jgi:8-oxo-dGTP diphosphatase